jgi:glyoxylate/hydroxypyruvate reductase A
MFNLLIASYLEPDYIDQIRGVSPALEVVYRPDLLPQPRYIADHIGHPLQRTPQQQAEWESLLARAEIMFDFDFLGLDQLRYRVPRLRWLQASSSGIGALVHRHQLHETGATFTTASGIHARPLAEFVLMAMLEQVKQRARAHQQQQSRDWTRFTTDELEGKTLGIVGLGRIGKEVARLARLLGMRVWASKRNPAQDPQDLETVDRLFGPDQLAEMLPGCDFVCLVAPHTPETEGMINQTRLAWLRPTATLINIARGALVVEKDLLDALDQGKLSQAVLDVVATEPLPATSPLWNHPKITLYPHSASTSTHENARLTDLFCDNLQRFLSGKALRNVLDTQRMY